MKKKIEIEKRLKKVEKLDRINLKHNQKYNELMVKVLKSWKLKDLSNNRYVRYKKKARDTMYLAYTFEGYIKALKYVLEVNK